MDLGRGEETVRCMERVTWKLILSYLKQPTATCYMAQETQTGALYQPRRVGWAARLEEFQEGRDICIPMSDSW